TVQYSLRRRGWTNGLCDASGQRKYRVLQGGQTRAGMGYVLPVGTVHKKHWGKMQHNGTSVLCFPCAFPAIHASAINMHLVKGDKSEKKIFVLDTSVILYAHNSIMNFAEHDVVIPITVLEELDQFKKGNDTRNFEARE